MKITELKIEGSWQIEFNKFSDDRGYFFESFKSNFCEENFKRPFKVEQANTSFSKKGSVRGIHYALLPPSQAKYVQCQNGSILDFIVDIRLGSPTFGQHVSVELNAKNPTAVFIEEGLAHAFVALEENTVVTYLVNQTYNPEREKGINPFDSDLSIPWPNLELILSEKDKNENSLKFAQENNLLPIYSQCKSYLKNLI